MVLFFIYQDYYRTQSKEWVESKGLFNSNDRKFHPKSKWLLILLSQKRIPVVKVNVVH